MGDKLTFLLFHVIYTSDVMAVNINTCDDTNNIPQLDWIYTVHIRHNIVNMVCMQHQMTLKMN